MIFVILACNGPGMKPGESAEIAVKWADIPQKMKDVDAFYIAYIDSSGTVRESVKGMNAQNNPVNIHTIFEGASFSKTFFAFAFWKALNRRDITLPEIKFSVCNPQSAAIPDVSPFQLLSHTIPCTDSCLIPGWKSSGDFKYSESGYLLLQKAVEKSMEMDLEQIAEKYIFNPHELQNASFVWHETNTNFVDGHYELGRLHRPVYKLNKPASNGSLYISGHDMTRFVSMLMNSSELDSMSIPVVPVKGFDHLSWGRGIGLEVNHGRNIAWQWGSNWSFNHILLINRTDHTAFICLTNSMIGAKRIRETARWLLGTDFQLFDYINWY